MKHQLDLVQLTPRPTRVTKNTSKEHMSVSIKANLGPHITGYESAQIMQKRVVSLIRGVTKGQHSVPLLMPPAVPWMASSPLYSITQ